VARGKIAVYIVTVAFIAALTVISCGKSAQGDDVLKNRERKESYIIGVDIARLIKSSEGYEYQFNPEVFFEGFSDVFEKGEPAVAIEEIRKVMTKSGDSTMFFVSNFLIKGYVTIRDKESYVFGAYHADITGSFPEAFNYAAFKKGFADEYNSGTLAMNEEDMNKVKEESKKRIERLRLNADAKVSREEKVLINLEYLEDNKKRESVKVLPSGLQYAVVREGKGEKPEKETSMVKVNYRAFFVDGREFDSSYRKGGPEQFMLEESIPGWKEGIMLMKEGSRYRLFVPSDLAYGKEGMQDVPPDATIIYDVELLEVIK
jgi:FKBP-type peptidyl-prolyl cis-trans isomerase